MYSCSGREKCRSKGCIHWNSELVQKPRHRQPTGYTNNKMVSIWVDSFCQLLNV